MQCGVLDVDTVAEDVADLRVRVGGDLDPGHVAKPSRQGYRPGAHHAVKGVVVGQGHDPHTVVGGQGGDLVRVAPSVTHSGMHMEIDEHPLSLRATPGAPLRELLRALCAVGSGPYPKVTVFLGPTVGGIKSSRQSLEKHRWLGCLGKERSFV